jgi:hypothetical protein
MIEALYYASSGGVRNRFVTSSLSYAFQLPFLIIQLLQRPILI